MTNPDGPDRSARPASPGAHNEVYGAAIDGQSISDILPELPTARVAIASAPLQSPTAPPMRQPTAAPAATPLTSDNLLAELPTARIAVPSAPMQPMQPMQPPADALDTSGAPANPHTPVHTTRAPSIADLPTGRLAAPSIADLPTGRLQSPTAPPLFGPSPQVPVAPPVASVAPAPPVAPARRDRRGERERAAYSEASTTKLPTPQTALPRRRGSLGWRIVNTALLVLLLLALGGVGALYLYGKTQAARPQQVANAYCAALTSDSYGPAYDLLSPGMRQQFTRQMYQADETLRDQLDGRVTQCVAQQQGKTPQFGYARPPTVVRFQVTLTRAASVTGLIALVPVGTDWKIGAIQPSLLGTDLAPLDLVGRLCLAFTAGDSAQVYSDFTPAFQHEQGSAKSFTGVFGSGLRVTQCVPSLHTYRLAKDDRSATMTISLTIKASVAHTNGAAQTFTETAQVVCVRSASGWLIDNLTLQQ